MVGTTLFSSISKVSTARTEPSETREVFPSSAQQLLTSVRSAMLVGICYYIGTRIGFAFTPNGQPNSTFWPPNAILLAAFLLIPRRKWWTLLLAVLPAHMLAQLQTGVPTWTAVGWFATNTGEALIGAYLITRLSPPNRVFDYVRGTLIFVVCGVLFAPFATSFLDAAAVILTHWGRGYWPLGAERFWTNALAELTVVPTIVLAISNGISWIRNATPSRWWEAGLLSVGTVLVTVVIFGLPTVSPATTPALLYAPLPFLLWATIRFGAGGLSSSLLCIALISLSYTMHGRVPFPNASTPQNILSLQILFCVVSVPLLFLSAYMSEIRRTQESLRHMSLRLVEAQEQERARIARELHDDINQRLAMLAFELEGLQDPSGNPGRVQELQQQLADISKGVHALSHELHSSHLEYLGAVRGMKSWCREFGERQRMEIDFRADVSSALNREVALCLFRVLQEALHNTTKHSEVKRVAVQLVEHSDGVHLIISDSGKGFDIDEAKQHGGLGLTSMKERVRLVNGDIEIKSKPMCGTTIHVRVPL